LCIQLDNNKKLCYYNNIIYTNYMYRSSYSYNIMKIVIKTISEEKPSQAIMGSISKKILKYYKIVCEVEVTSR